MTEQNLNGKRRRTVIIHRLHSRLKRQEQLIAELYYASDIEIVRSRIREFMEVGERTQKAFLKKKFVAAMQNHQILNHVVE